VPDGLFALKVIPAFFGFAFEIMISRLQTWSDVVISHTMYKCRRLCLMRLAEISGEFIP